MTYTYDVDTARQLYEQLDLGSCRRPSYSSVMKKLWESQYVEDVKMVKVYLIGDGYTGEGSWDGADNNYAGLKMMMSFWSFCLGKHSDTNCCFRSMMSTMSAALSGCHHHAQGFNGNCILPLG